MILTEEEFQLLNLTGGLKCNSCQLPSKCCDFIPFIPNKTVLKLLREGTIQPSLFYQKPIQLSFFGILPSLKYIKLREDKKNTEKCVFLSESRQCKIWSMRPSVCRAYDCQASGIVSEVLDRLEAKLHAIEIESSVSLFNKSSLNMSCDGNWLKKLLSEYLGFSGDAKRENIKPFLLSNNAEGFKSFLLAFANCE